MDIDYLFLLVQILLVVIIIIFGYKIVQTYIEDKQ
ncbi:SrtB family sortase, partial [Staphylococcus aureus]|nr:SrtB family sortase [Staphylococcus aureus]